MAMAAENLKRLEAKRSLYASRITEAYRSGTSARTDLLERSQFKARFEGLERAFEKFGEIHNNMIMLLKEDEEFEGQDIVRREIDTFYYKTKALYNDMFQASVSVENARPPVVRNESNVKLPKISIAVFDGNLKNWPTFYDLFKKLIHENTSLANIEKFQYLLSFVDKAPLNLLKGVPLTEDNYSIAFDSLVKRYQNKRLLATNALNEMSSITLKNPSAKEFRALLDTFSESVSSLKVLGFAVEHWDFLLFNNLLQKLDVATRTDFEVEYGAKEMPTFQNLSDFLENKCKALESVQHLPLKVMRKSNNYSSSSFVNTLSTNTCLMCKGDHYIPQCPSFLAKPTADRFSFVKNNRLCVNCLRPSHQVKTCTSRYRCRTCQRRHHSLLHVTRTATDSSVEAVDSSFSELPAATPSGVSTSSATTTLTSTLGLETVVLLATAIVDIFDAKGNSHAIRVLLDSANQANFINEKCAHRLCLTKRSLTTAIFGLNQMHSISAKGVAACAIQPHKATGPIFSFDAIVISKLCQDLPTFNINAQNWKHLDNLELADGNFHADKSIDLLIGAEVFAHVLKEGRIIGKQGEPTALNTVFGWVLLGKIHSSRETTKRVETYCTYINEATLPETLHKFWEVGRTVRTNLSGNRVSYSREGRFMVTLPFKNSEPDLRNTFPLAHRRFLLLETRLLKNLDLQPSVSFDKEEPSFIKVLGLHWNPDKDSFSYKCQLNDKPCTKRNILSDIARIFDPLGFLSPITLLAKNLMQRLWESKTNWDEVPANSIVKVWRQLKQEMQLRFSSLTYIQRILGYTSRFIHNCRHPTDKHSGSLTSKELRASLMYLVKHVQTHNFGN
ncbi:hypothetical protein PPYR_11679 [Photinus pyralis]|uniref:Uncharacterized protein n=1 Tax=Photinus pyralis TaxID=7054 RepID=A0A5N4ABY7_PHOPY|nr:hypothetical protein PPYR_11679 [Photinus pyralis]